MRRGRGRPARANAAPLRWVGRGDRIVVILGNQVELWESMLVAIKLGVVVIPSSTLLAPADGIVMTRVIEPGTVVLPSSAVYSMALTGEVWIRAFTDVPPKLKSVNRIVASPGAKTG